MSYPVAQIKYALDGVQEAWLSFSNRLQQQNLANLPEVIPISPEQWSSFQLGVLSLHYVRGLSSTHPSLQRALLTSVYFDLLCMDIPSNVQDPSRELQEQGPSAESQHVDTETEIATLEAEIAHLERKNRQFQQKVLNKALYFDDDVDALRLENIPHNNIVMRSIWLLCDILRVIRNQPFPQTHPSMRSMIQLSSYLWTIVNDCLKILVANIALDDEDTYIDRWESIWDLYPGHERLILDNLAIDMTSKSANIIMTLQTYFMMPLPFLRNLHPYQYHNETPISPSPQRLPSDYIPACNKHSPSNLLLLLSHYSLLSPIPTAAPEKPLFSGFIALFRPRSEVAKAVNEAFQRNVRPTLPQPDATVQLHSVADFHHVAGDAANIPHCIPSNEPTGDAHEYFCRVKTNTAWVVADIWKLFLGLCGASENDLLTVAFIDRWKILGVLKDHIERSIHSIYWDGEHYRYFPQFVKSGGDPKINQGLNVLSFLKPLGSKLIPNDLIITANRRIAEEGDSIIVANPRPAQDVLPLGNDSVDKTSRLIPTATNQLDEELGKVDPETRQGMYQLDELLSSRHHEFLEWKDNFKDFEPFDPLHKSRMPQHEVDKTIHLVNLVPRSQRDEFSFSFYAGYDMRTNEAFRTLSWSLFAYFELHKGVRSAFVCNAPPRSITLQIQTNSLSQYQANRAGIIRVRKSLEMLRNPHLTPDSVCPDKVASDTFDNPGEGKELHESDDLDPTDNSSQYEDDDEDDVLDAEATTAEDPSEAELHSPYAAQFPSNCCDKYYLDASDHPNRHVIQQYLLSDIHTQEYFDQFTKDSVYICSVIVLLYRSNNVDIWEADMGHFHGNNQFRTPLDFIDILLGSLFRVGGWLANSTLLSLLFINSDQSIEPHDQICDQDGRVQYDKMFSTMFDPVTSLPFNIENNSVLCVPSSVTSQSTTSTTPTLDAKPTTPNYITPLLDMFIDYTLHLNPNIIDDDQVVDNPKLNQTLVDFRSDIEYRASRRCEVFLTHFLFLYFSPEHLIYDSRHKELYKWVLCNKKQFVQLYEQEHLLFQHLANINRLAPHLPTHLPAYAEDEHRFEHMGQISIPISQTPRLNLPDYILAYPYDDHEAYQYPHPLNTTSLPVDRNETGVAELLQTHLSAQQLYDLICTHQEEDRIVNNIGFKEEEEAREQKRQQLRLFDQIRSPPLPQHSPSLTNNQLAEVFKITTRDQLSDIYHNQFELINQFYFHSNTIESYLFRIQRRHAIDHLKLLKFRFARDCIAFSRTRKVPINPEIFTSLFNNKYIQFLPEWGEYVNIFDLPENMLKYMTDEHLELFSKVDANANHSTNYQTQFATQAYNFQHFLTLALDYNSQHDHTLVNLLSPWENQTKPCPVTSRNHNPADLTENTKHPLLWQIWQSYSMVSEFQTYVYSKYLYNRSSVLEFETYWDDFFTLTNDPIITYFHYVASMLYSTQNSLSLDITCDLPILHHFLFTVNHYALHRRFTQFVYSSMGRWNPQINSPVFEFVWTLDHIYRAALERCLAVDEKTQLEQSGHPPSSFNVEKEISPEHTATIKRNYSKRFIAPVIHQYIEFLSSVIFSASYASFSCPYYHDDQVWAEAHYPGYVKELSLGWNTNKSVDSADFPVPDEFDDEDDDEDNDEDDGEDNDEDDEDEDDDEDEEGLIGKQMIELMNDQEDCYLVVNSFTKPRDRNNKIRPTMRLLQPNCNIFTYNLRHLHNQWRSNPPALQVLFSSNHPMLCAMAQVPILMGDAHNVLTAPAKAYLWASEHGTLLTPQFMYKDDTNIDKHNKTNISAVLAAPMVKLPQTCRTRQEYAKFTTPVAFKKVPLAKLTKAYFQKEKKKVVDQYLGDVQPLFSEQFSFQIQYCIESFIDLMLLCDSTAVPDGAETKVAENSREPVTDYSYLSDIFNSINFTTPMDLPTTLAQVDNPSLQDLDGAGLFERKAVDFESPFASTTHPPLIPHDNNASNHNNMSTSDSLYITPTTVPIAPLCGLLIPKKPVRLGYYDPAVFSSQLFHTFHIDPSTNSTSLNPILRGILDWDNDRFINYRPHNLEIRGAPDHYPRLDRTVEQMMIHNCSLHIQEHRSRVYGGCPSTKPL